MKAIKARASFDGSNIVSDVKVFLKSGSPDNNKTRDQERYISNLNTSLRILGVSESEIGYFETLDDMLFENEERILTNMLSIVSGKAGFNGDDELIATGIVRWAISEDKLNLLTFEYADCYKNGLLKSNFMRKFESFSNFINSVENIDIEKIKEKIKGNISEFKYLPVKELARKSSIRKLRTAFREALIKETKDELKKYISWNNSFDFPDAAHIISVKRCVDEERIDSIADPNNGLILDPNTHRLFDRDQIMSIDELNIPEAFLTVDRIKYLKEFFEG